MSLVIQIKAVANQLFEFNLRRTIEAPVTATVAAPALAAITAWPPVTPLTTRLPFATTSVATTSFATTSVATRAAAGTPSRTRTTATALARRTIFPGHLLLLLFSHVLSNPLVV